MFVSFNKNANHKSCSEDFVSGLVSQNGINGYLTLSDGCSTSKGDVVFGARFIHRILKNIFDIDDGKTNLHDAFPSYLNDALDTGFLTAEDLQITFLCAYFDVSVNSLYLKLIGDGYFYVEDMNGHYNIVKFDYKDNMPCYLGYTLQQFNILQMRQYGQCDICIDDNIFSNVIYSAHFKLSDIKKLFLFSDGIDQIENTDPHEFIKQICQDEKADSEDENFLNRKAKFLLKNKKNNDDVSFIGYIKRD